MAFCIFVHQYAVAMKLKYIFITLLLTISIPVFSQHYAVPFWEDNPNSQFGEKLFGLKDEKGNQLIAPQYRSLFYIGNRFFNAQNDSLSILFLEQKEIVKNQTFTRFYQHIGSGINQYNQESVIGENSNSHTLYDLHGKVSKIGTSENIKILYSIDDKKVIISKNEEQATLFILVNNKIIFSDSSERFDTEIEGFTFDTIVKYRKDILINGEFPSYNYFSLNKLRMLNIDDLISYSQIEKLDLSIKDESTKNNSDKEIRMITETSLYNTKTGKSTVIEKTVTYGKPNIRTNSLDKTFELLISQKHANKLYGLALHKAEVKFLESEIIKDELLLSKYDSIDYKQNIFIRNSFSSQYLFENRKNHYQIFATYKKGKVGLLSKKGKVIIEPEYDLINFTSSTILDDLYTGYNGVIREDAYFVIKKNDLYGVLKLAYDSTIDDYAIVYYLKPIFKHPPLFYYDNYYGIDKLKIFALQGKYNYEIIHFANEQGVVY